jgi:hypothetical protein
MSAFRTLEGVGGSGVMEGVRRVRGDGGSGGIRGDGGSGGWDQG